VAMHAFLTLVLSNWGLDAPRKVQFTALYKDGETWKGSQSSTRKDLPLLTNVAGQVHTYLYEQNGSSAG
jgi:hypothetical protein